LTIADVEDGRFEARLVIQVTRAAALAPPTATEWLWRNISPDCTLTFVRAERA